MRAGRWISFFALAGLACGKDVPQRSDSVAQSGSTSAAVPWVTELGALLAVPGDSDGTAIVLFPPAPEEPSNVALLRVGDDSSAAARLTPTDMQVCGDVATGRLTAGNAGEWTLALSRGITPLRVDSIEAMPPSDSSALAADVARLASTVANEAESRFVGLPFAVLAAHRLEIDGATIVVARVARRIPQEAAPLEERTILIGDRRDNGPFRIRYSRRSSGSEDVVDHFALLGAVRVGAKHFLVLEIERETGSRYEILERDSAGAWQMRWSRVLSC